MPDPWEVRSGMTRTQMYFSEGSPKRVGEAVPTGWHEQRVASANASYELISSQGRLMYAHDAAHWGAAAHSIRGYLSSAEYGDVVSTLPDLWEEEQRWQRKATMQEAVRLRSLLSSAPKPRRGQHVNQRVLPVVHSHFTTLKAGNRLRMHRNLHLPLDQPHDLEPMVPRAWKLAQSKSSPALSRMAERRGLKSSPTRASSQRLSSQQVGEAEAGRQEERSPLHQFEPDVSVPSAPPGMSGLPASVSLHKVWSYSDPSRKPPPMAFMDAKGKIRRVGSHESISKSSS